MSLIKTCTGQYYNNDALEREFNYCVKKCEYWSGYGIRTDSIESAIFDMRRVKILSQKEDGKQLYHMVISIRRPNENNNDKSTENTSCYLIGSEVSIILLNYGYQNAFFKHNDNGNIHLHFIINSVNFITEKKLSGICGINNEIFSYIKGQYPFLKWEGPYYV